VFWKRYANFLQADFWTANGQSADCALHKEANQIRAGSPVDVTALHKVRGDTVKA